MSMQHELPSVISDEVPIPGTSSTEYEVRYCTELRDITYQVAKIGCFFNKHLNEIAGRDFLVSSVIPIQISCVIAF